MKEDEVPEIDKFKIAEAAKVLRVSTSTLRRWDASGRLPAKRDFKNGYRFYTRDQLLEFMSSRQKVRYERT